MSDSKEKRSQDSRWERPEKQISGREHRYEKYSSDDALFEEAVENQRNMQRLQTLQKAFFFFFFKVDQ